MVSKTNMWWMGHPNIILYDAFSATELSPHLYCDERSHFCLQPTWFSWRSSREKHSAPNLELHSVEQKKGFNFLFRCQISYCPMTSSHSLPQLLLFQEQAHSVSASQWRAAIWKTSTGLGKWKKTKDDIKLFLRAGSKRGRGFLFAHKAHCSDILTVLSTPSDALQDLE